MGECCDSCARLALFFPSQQTTQDALDVSSTRLASYLPPQESTQDALDILSTHDMRDALNKSCPQWSNFSAKELLQVKFVSCSV